MTELDERYRASIRRRILVALYAIGMVALLHGPIASLFLLPFRDAISPAVAAVLGADTVPTDLVLNILNITLSTVILAVFALPVYHATGLPNFYLMECENCGRGTRVDESECGNCGAFSEERKHSPYNRMGDSVVDLAVVFFALSLVVVYFSGGVFGTGPLSMDALATDMHLYYTLIPPVFILMGFSPIGLIFFAIHTSLAVMLSARLSERLRESTESEQAPVSQS